MEFLKVHKLPNPRKILPANSFFSQFFHGQCTKLTKIPCFSSSVCTRWAATIEKINFEFIWLQDDISTYLIQVFYGTCIWTPENAIDNVFFVLFGVPQRWDAVTGHGGDLKGLGAAKMVVGRFDFYPGGSLRARTWQNGGKGRRSAFPKLGPKVTFQGRSVVKLRG